MKLTAREKRAIREEIERKKSIPDDMFDWCGMGELTCLRCPLKSKGYCESTFELCATDTSHRFLMRAMRITLLEDALEGL